MKYLKNVGGFIKWIFVDDYGLTVAGIGAVILAIIAALCAIMWGIWYVWFSGPACVYPNHLVYAGWNYQLDGKVQVPTDQYWCEAN